MALHEKAHLNAVAVITYGVLFCLLWMPFAAWAGTIRHDVSDSEYLALAGEVPYEGVGKFNWREGSASYLASGTLINERWVLTAGHVVDGGNITNMTFLLNGVIYHASEWFTFPGWSGNLKAGNDIGLVRLREWAVGIELAALYDQTNETGLTITLVGYGRTGTGLTGDTLSSGTKRAGQNAIEGTGSLIGYSPNILIADFDEPNPSATGGEVPLPLEYNVARGDSGGGGFIDFGGQTWLAGVISFIYAYDGSANASYGDGSGLIRVSSYIDWIRASAVLPITGDFNEDGVVDLADYSLWADDFGWIGMPGFNASDGNRDGWVDIADYTIWADHYGAHAAATLFVPEPTVGVMLLGGLVLLLFWRRNRHNSGGKAIF